MTSTNPHEVRSEDGHVASAPRASPLGHARGWAQCEGVAVREERGERGREGENVEEGKGEREGPKGRKRKERKGENVKEGMREKEGKRGERK